LNSEPATTLDQLRKNGQEALAAVYKEHRADFIHWITSQYTCGEEQAKDLYQQSIIVFYENVVSGKLKVLTSSVKTYLFSIGKNKYKELVRQQAKSSQLNAQDFPLEHDPSSESMLQRIEHCIERLGEPCRSLLIQFYYHQETMEQLAARFDYKNVETAKNQKYKCLERLRKMVKEAELANAL
jgi:RNA polymerase sigma factor (sigma-70 family)